MSDAEPELHKPENHVRIVTAASLFDGHDASINIMRRIMQTQGAEVIHLGHNRSVQEVIDAALEEDAQGIAVSSYQGGHVEYFEYLTDHSIDVMRMNNYALPAGTITLDGELTGMGEHTDFGIVTVLWADQVAGLQVLGRDGDWHDVQPIDKALLINLGDLTARLTNDRWMSTLHRVKPPIVDGTIKRRRSVAFFHDGNADAVISTLPSHLDADDGLAYAPITVSEHVKAKLEGSQKGKANVAAVREASRVLAAQEAH